MTKVIMIEGEFTLSDGTKTKFSVDDENSWQQWGNSKENAGLSVDLVRKIQNALFAE